MPRMNPAEVLALDVAHVEEELSLDLAPVVDRDDVRVVEPCGDLRLPQEPDPVLLVVAEFVPDAVVDVDRYADAITELIETKLHGTLESREVLETNPKLGRVLHAKATHDGMQLEYYYGLFARGERAFQVIAFTHQESFPRLEDDFMKVIETFEISSAVRVCVCVMCVLPVLG